ncbi:MAG: hypothetical protein ACKOXV_06920 [Bacteroidota bacterium]
MSEVKSFTVYDDGGHCYCAVPLEYLRELRISNLISTYSYINHNAGVVYLEEDRDMGVFCERMKADGIEFTLNEEFVEEIDYIDDDGDECTMRWIHQFHTYEGDEDCEDEQNIEGLPDWLIDDEEDFEDEDADYCDVCQEHKSDCECIDDEE